MDDLFLKVAQGRFIPISNIKSIETTEVFFKVLPEEDRTDGYEVFASESLEEKDASGKIPVLIIDTMVGEVADRHVVYGSAAIQIYNKIVRSSQFASISDDQFENYEDFVFPEQPDGA